MKLVDNSENENDVSNIEYQKIQIEKKNYLLKNNKTLYFHLIRYALQNNTISGNRVNIKEYYGYGLGRSSSQILDNVHETTLPKIKPTYNDFHKNLSFV